jgi:PhzF family phenazine biosynthesis protein
MKIKIYQVDAFTDKLFGGNPAAVCILDNWLDAALMQSIGAENNLAETAFILKKADVYEIRWFTPAVEVDLCGHATLAAAHVVFNYLGHSTDEVVFHSHRSGILKVKKDGAILTLDFPTDVYAGIEAPELLIQALGVMPHETYKGKTDFMAVLSSQHEVETLKPNFAKLEILGERGVIVTAKGDDVDFVSRFFAPQSGIDEDPVTGSAHTTLTPYWAKALGRNELTAIQLSSRKGHLTCRYLGERVAISGNAVTYLTGEIEVADK